jgi:hypothetical protein
MSLLLTSRLGSQIVSSDPRNKWRLNVVLVHPKKVDRDAAAFDSMQQVQDSCTIGSNDVDRPETS